MLNAVTMATAVAYESFVEKLDRLYKGCWHLVVQADELARSEHMLRLKVVGRDGNRSWAGKAPAMWNPDNPWEALFRKLLKDSDFWAEQVHLPANAWLAHGSKGRAAHPLGGHCREQHPRWSSAALKAETWRAPKGTPKNLGRGLPMPVDEEAKKRKFQEAEDKDTNTKGKGQRKRKRENPQPVMRGTTTMGPVLDSLQDPLAEERSQENIRCTACGSPGHPSHQCGTEGKLIDDLKMDWRKFERRSQGQGHQCEGFATCPILVWGPIQIKEKGTNKDDEKRADDKERTPWRETQEEKIRTEREDPENDDEPKAEFNGKLMTA